MSNPLPKDSVFGISLLHREGASLYLLEQGATREQKET